MKMWGGRFSEESSNLLEIFNESISFDKEMYKEDIEGSIAHAKMLNKIGIFNEKELSLVVNALDKIKDEILLGKTKFSTKLEDIHMNIEYLLTKEVGELGKKLHTARSRNDQVALDVKMYTRKQTEMIIKKIIKLQKKIIKISEKNYDVILPGYTHLQRAQPITLAFYFMTYFNMLKRDYERFSNSLERLATMPLGSGALSGTPYNSDRFFLSKELGFDMPSENALDSVSDRDFIVEFQSNSSMLMMHLSRLSEEMILWASSEFAFIEISDKYSTGSSIMPQKKNPDAFELIRGKTGRVYGNLFSILTVMKGLPLAYNKDMQEDKESLFDTSKTITIVLEVLEDMISEIKFNKEKMLSSVKDGYLNATDLADYLVTKGLEFRNAHSVSGNLVKYSIENNKRLEELTIKEFKSISEIIEEDVYEYINVEKSVNRKISYGGSGKKSVEKSIENAKEWLNKLY
ncbi:argininosuccinate lyase [Helicovermis profundi]|uniref:Argininosuccinate lyase n=1 Tax=Helicovermis profundi TaxID=3065157 RepID=A0AAU9E725_9FIRM|nr:argininosuccinate lyase [Clostridia bacterium S502]